MDGFRSAGDLVVDAMNAAEPIWPQLILIIAALLVPAIFSICKCRKTAAGFTLAAVIIAIAVTCHQMYNGYAGEFMDLFRFDAFSGVMMLLFLTVVFFTVLISPAYSNTTKHSGEYYSLLMVATAGMMFVASATDLITIFIGVELASISSYALVAMKKNDPRSAEAAVKYLIIGGISTGISLYGLSLMYGLTGSTQLDVLAAYFTTAGFSPVFAVAFITLLAGYGFKIAAVPFHMWAPDVYEGAATPVTSFLATGSKKMGFVVFMKIFMLIFVGATLVPVPEIQWMFAIVAAITMTVGNVAALRQTNIKRMLAYSSIAQAGYILIMVAVATQFATSAGIFYMVVHVFMKGGAFIVVAALITAGLGEEISGYRGLSKRAPFTAFAMMIFMFSLAGIPPLGGFMGKFLLFGSALFPAGIGTELQTQWIWLVLVALINSAISLYYYARVVKTMYVDKGEEKRIKVPRTHSIAMVLCVIGILVLGLLPGYAMEWCSSAADMFFTYVP